MLPKNFNKIRRGLRLLNEAKTKKSISFPQIELYQAVNRNNYQSVANLVELAQEHNCSGVHFAHLVTRRGQLDELSLSPEQEEVCLQNLAKIRPWMEELGISHNIDLLNLRYKRGERVWEHAACFTPWFRLRVLVDGTVKICRGYDKAFGHLDEQSLSEIWNRPSLRAFRRRVSTQEGFACIAKNSDCCACCFFIENLRVESIYRWFRPFAEWSTKTSALRVSKW
jgi:MoaA/NifB/PqqE/SkfB family radical SAM enzyme